ncbi:MAG TPA: hypothetical protein PK472_06175, partial [Pseudomonadota bacterium]|nr:hypothetical protein [Pseudomonadota bacterium]
MRTSLRPARWIIPWLTTTSLGVGLFAPFLTAPRASAQSPPVESVAQEEFHPTADLDLPSLLRVFRD